MEKDDQIINAISELLKSRNQLAKQALGEFRYEILQIISPKSHGRIEHLLC